MRIFLDTNVLASALTTRGLCADLFQAVTKDHVLIVGVPVVAELRRILPRSFKLPAPLVEAYLGVLAEIGEPADRIVSPTVAIPDPDDVAVIGSALGAAAELFVTGDKLLLGLANVDGLPIVSPRGCWERLAAH
ncbi:MAG: PIN domain-containing protein [Chromatiales bacterium]|nr:PIN domain-containing protein [Chromatiales bacterium]